MQGFRYATFFHLNMGYYTLPLCPESQKICTTVSPFGKFSYSRLVMGWAGAPFAFQECMDRIF